MQFSDTITAISTAPGNGAIAIVRLSGPDSWAIAGQIFSLQREQIVRKKDSWQSHQALHGYAFDQTNLVDEVMVIAYKAPRTYTGEDLVEINCHGGSVVTNEVLGLCLKHGARLAKEGEFTQRAFLNGKMDLTQAEAVLDVIQAKTSRQRSLASSALTGRIGDRIKSVRKQLIELLSRIVAGIDFPEEVGELSFEDLETSIDDSEKELSLLAKTTMSGRYMREGLKVAIVGKPNAGKSSLLNRLLQFERAIVTDIPGTTRDSLEEILDIDGLPVVLIDTAGMRSTDDAVERIGIERSRKAVKEAQLVLFVTDASREWSADDSLVAELLNDKPHILLDNKVDLFSKNTGLRDVSESCVSQLSISAKTGAGIENLCNAIKEFALPDGKMVELGGSLNARQGELCNQALHSLALVKETLANNMPHDCLATDLKGAIDCLSEICGESVSEEVITNVFAKFCIGK